MNEIEVGYSKNKAGTYVQFKLEVHASELEELVAYDKLMQDSIKAMFERLFREHEMGFATDSSYVIHDGERTYLEICLLGESKPELDRTLSELGIRRIV